MVVGRGEGDDLADRELGEGLRRHRAELAGVFHRAGRDDQALAGHQARDRGGRAESAGVGQRDGRSFEVGDLELSGARARDNVVGGRNELRERHRAGVLDVGDDQGARAVLLFDIHREAEVDLVAAQAHGRVARVVVGVVQARKILQGLENRPGDQVREGDLRLVSRGAVLVDQPPVLFEELDGDLAL